MVNKVDSNLTGLRFAQEESLGVLPASPVWNQAEPNEYGDFGSEVTTVARSPINPSRQRKKGVVVDLDASAGFTSDLTQENLRQLLPGFFFADWREKANQTVTAVAAGSATVADETGFAVGDIIKGSGFAVDANNGAHTLTAVAAGTLTAATMALEAVPPAGATMRVAGHMMSVGDASIVVTAGGPGLETAGKDLTELGLIPGEWVYIGGDAAVTQFATAANNGFARVKTVSANRIEFDKSAGVMVNDGGAGKTIALYFGDVLKNESDPDLIKMYSFQLERSLGAAGFEYVVGCVPNQLTINMSTADKVTVDLSFVGIDSETITNPATPKAGSRPTIAEAPAFNTTSDFGRLRLESDGVGLANFLMEASLTIDNGVEPLKALSKLGAFDVSAGDFAVSGDITAYFCTLEAVAAVRNNSDATFDFAFVKDGAGMLFDVPLASLGNGRLNVQKDQAIELPVTQEAAEHPTLHHTLLCSHFPFLPAVAG